MSTDDLSAQLADADRLQVITQRIGFVFWQVQELESTAAKCLVLLTSARPGMGEAAGAALLQSALRQTFGRTVKQIVKAKLLDPGVERRLQLLLRERNWLVHSSKSTNRDAVRSDDGAARLLRRIDAMDDETHALSEEFLAVLGRNATRLGIDDSRVTAEASKLLERWHRGEDS